MPLRSKTSASLPNRCRWYRAFPGCRNELVAVQVTEHQPDLPVVSRERSNVVEPNRPRAWSRALHDRLHYLSLVLVDGWSGHEGKGRRKSLGMSRWPPRGWCRVSRTGFPDLRRLWGASRRCRAVRRSPLQVVRPVARRRPAAHVANGCRSRRLVHPPEAGGAAVVPIVVPHLSHRQ